MTTLPPSATSIRACAAPIPRAPPLMSATLPSTRPMRCSPLSLSCALIGVEEALAGDQRQVQCRPDSRRRGHHRGNRVDHPARAAPRWRRSCGRPCGWSGRCRRCTTARRRSPPGRNRPAVRAAASPDARSSRSRVTWSMTMTGLPLTSPTISNRSAAWPPFGDVPGGDVESLRRRDSRARVLDLVDLDAEARRQLPDRCPPRHAEHAGLQQHRRLVECPPEAHDVEHHGGAVIRRVVGDLHAADLFEALAGACDRERDQVVGEAGVDARDEETRITLSRSIFHAERCTCRA